MKPLHTLAAFAGLFIGGVLQAATYTSEWDEQFNEGSYLWGDSQNWIPHGSPANSGGDIYVVKILDSAGRRTILTPGTPTQVGRLIISQATGSGSTTLELGGNLSVDAQSVTGNASGFVNTTSSREGLVIDLKGHTLSFVQASLQTNGIGSSSNYTIRSTGGGQGVFETPLFSSTATNVYVDDNVTVRITNNGGNYTQQMEGITWSDNSVLQYIGQPQSVTRGLSVTSEGLANLVIGDSSMAHASSFFVATSTMRVRGDLTINSYVGATGGDASGFHFNGSNFKNFYVGGHFRDSGGAAASDYGNSTIIFNGGDSEKEVSIARETLTTNFRVGENASITGDIALQHRLTTTGNLIVRQNSRLNAGNVGVKVNNLTFENQATLAFRLNSESSALEALGNLTLSSFNLELIFDGDDWVNGEDLILFRYNGSLSGMPTLVDIIAPDGFTYGALEVDTLNKTVYLSQVSIPEPSFAMIAFVGVAGLLVTRRLRLL